MTRDRHLIWAATAGALLAAADSPALADMTAGIAERPTTWTVGVSPGSARAFTPVAEACPTFNWTQADEARGYELRVFRVEDLEREDALPELAVELPAGATGWTPPGDRCLAAGGKYAWSVRALGGGEARGADGPWSEALLFAVAAAPTAAELQRALEVVQRYLGTARVGERTLGTAEANILPTRAVAAVESPRSPSAAEDPHEAPAGGGPATAVRGEVPDPAGETYGVRGVSNSPDGAGVRADNNVSGPDLVLGGSPVAEITESSFSRSSASNLTFDFTNPGAGTMTVQADGADLVTTAAGSALWVNQTGDTMSGTLSLGGNALTNAGDIALNTASEITKGGSRFLWDDVTENFAAGRSALASNTTGQSNTALGTQALRDNATGLANVAVGRRAMYRNLGGHVNTAVGIRALGSNTAGSSNTAAGAYALSLNGDGNSNTALGHSALAGNSSGSYSTAVGFWALRLNTAGGNTAVGSRALQSNTIGSNTAVGYNALTANVNGYRNTAVGISALAANVSGTGNTALGRRALLNSTGTGNIGIGTSGGSSLTTGNYNIAIGNGGVAGEGGRIRIGVQGTQTETFIAGIHGNTTSGGITVFVNSNGELGTSTSSRRFKEDIHRMAEASERLYDLEPVTFRYREEFVGHGERPQEYGLVAEVFPELVVYDQGGGPYTVRYEQLTPMLVNELQRLRAELEALWREAARLEGITSKAPACLPARGYVWPG